MKVFSKAIFLAPLFFSFLLIFPSHLKAEKSGPFQVSDFETGSSRYGKGKWKNQGLGYTAVDFKLNYSGDGTATDVKVVLELFDQEGNNLKTARPAKKENKTLQLKNGAGKKLHFDCPGVRGYAEYRLQIKFKINDKRKSAEYRGRAQGSDIPSYIDKTGITTKALLELRACDEKSETTGKGRKKKYHTYITGKVANRGGGKATNIALTVSFKNEGKKVGKPQSYKILKNGLGPYSNSSFKVELGSVGKIPYYTSLHFSLEYKSEAAEEVVYEEDTDLPPVKKVEKKIKVVITKGPIQSKNLIIDTAKKTAGGLFENTTKNNITSLTVSFKFLGILGASQTKTFSQKVSIAPGAKQKITFNIGELNRFTSVDVSFKLSTSGPKKPKEEKEKKVENKEPEKKKETPKEAPVQTAEPEEELF